MLLAVAPLTDVSRWARSSGLEILLILTGTALAVRATSWVAQRATGGLDPETAGGDALVRTEAVKHRLALTQVATWAIEVVLYCVAALMVLQRLSIPLSGLVPVATVVGLALGFGAQRVVQDLLAGFFLVAERQYGYGDVVRLSLVNGSAPVTGTVEDVSLRVTQLRTMNGEVVITPNGQIVQVTNLSRDWARAVVDVPVPVGSDVAQVSDTLEDVGNRAFRDERLGSLLLDPPSVMGVESLQVDQLNIRMVARTLPGRQFEVSRALRSRAATALRRQGVAVQPVAGGAEPTGAT